MFQHPQRIKKIIRESPSIILPSPTGSTHVPTAMDVPRDGYQYVPNPVEQSNKKQQSKQKWNQFEAVGWGGGRMLNAGNNKNGLKAKKNSLVNTLSFFDNLSKATQTKWDCETRWISDI